MSEIPLSSCCVNVKMTTSLNVCQKSFEQARLSLGSVVNILATFSNANIANILKNNKRIKRYHIKAIGCPLLILIDIVIFDQETEK